MSIFDMVSSSVTFTSICSCRYFNFPSGCDNKFTFTHLLKDEHFYTASLHLWSWLNKIGERSIFLYSFQLEQFIYWIVFRIKSRVIASQHPYPFVVLVATLGSSSLEQLLTMQFSSRIYLPFQFSFSTSLNGKMRVWFIKNAFKLLTSN